MKILAMTHGMPPSMCAGAEWSMLILLSALQARGHDCRIHAMRGGDAKPFEGVQRFGSYSPPVYTWADLVLTDHATGKAAGLQAARFHKPCVNYVHNAAQTLYAITDAWLFNSNHLRDEILAQHVLRHEVLHPVVRRQDCVGERRGGKLVQIGLSKDKGGGVFWMLPRQRPSYRFVGYLGAYDEQILCPRPPENVEIRPVTADPRALYADASVVLMPSYAETFGRVAVEAAFNQVPLISSPTTGVKEALGEACVYVDSPLSESWLKAIDDLVNDDDRYRELSAAAYAKACDWEVRYAAELDATEAMLVELAGGRHG